MPEEGRGPQAVPEYDAMETAHALEPQVGSEPGEEPEATEPAREPEPHEPPD